MIPPKELNIAIELAKKYDVGRMLLIGSSVHKEFNEIGDYDFAIQDFPPGNFFKFYGELFRVFPKNVDLIDLSGEMTKFKKIVLRDGILIYDKNSS